MMESEEGEPTEEKHNGHFSILLKKGFSHTFFKINVL